MNNSKETRKDDLLRLIKWIADYPDMWTKVTTENFLSVEECMEVVHELEEQGFHLLIPVFLENCLATEMGYGMDMLVAYKMVESWEKKSLEEIQEEFNSVLGNP